MIWNLIITINCVNYRKKIIIIMLPLIMADGKISWKEKIKFFSFVDCITNILYACLLILLFNQCNFSKFVVLKIRNSFRNILL